MITDLFYMLDSWNWVLLGLVLLLLELLLPGVFCFWFGLAALATAGIVALGSLIGLSGGWQGQLFVFLVLSILFVWRTRPLAARQKQVGAPFLNRRTDEMLGLVTTLSEPITDGKGYIRIHDTIWRITGTDMPKGAKVRITGFHNGAFHVKPENPQKDEKPA